MVALILIALLVAAVWGNVYLLRGSLIAGALCAMIAAACLGHPFFHYDAGGLPLTIDRVVVAVVVAAYLVQRVLGRTDPKPLGWADAALLALIAMLVVSGSCVGWAGSRQEPYVTFWRLVNGYLTPFALYWVVRQAPLGRSQVALVQGVLVGLGVYLGVTGILEVTGQWWAVFPKHIADPEVGLHFGRARGPMVHAVSFGLYVGICALATWVYRWRFGGVGRSVLMLLLPLMLTGLVCSFTRSVWIGMAVATLIVLCLTLSGLRRWWLLGSVAAAGLLLATTQMEALMSFQREDSATDSRRSVSMRGSFAYVSWRMFLDRPLLGVGFGQFREAKLPYLDDRRTDLDLESIRDYIHHNTFLSLLTETGLLGLTLYLALLALWARDAWVLTRSPLSPDWARGQGILFLGVLGIYVSQAMFHELTYSPIDNSLVFLLAGLTVGLRERMPLHHTLSTFGNIGLGPAVRSHNGSFSRAAR
jgi:O-antigen ligase